MSSFYYDLLVQIKSYDHDLTIRKTILGKIPILTTLLLTFSTNQINYLYSQTKSYYLIKFNET